LAIIETHDLTKKFGDLVAVDHVSLSVEEEEIFGFLGPNGAGKTTTINMLTTLLRPNEGSAQVAGFDVVKEANEVRSTIGLVPQELTVDEDLTGMENMLLQARLYHVPMSKAKPRINEILGLLGLANAAKRKVETYSGGMRKRLELAAGLIHYPKVLFLDEPTLGLDVQTRAAMWDYIRKLRDEQKITIFLTTHYMEEADALSDRIAIIDHAKIIAQGTPYNLKESLGGDIIEITPFEENPDIKELLASLPTVKEVKNKGDVYRLKVMHGEETLPKIMEKICENNIKIRRVSLIEPTLDQVFLEFTGRTIREMESGREDVWKMRRYLRRMRG
jgi:ABC-2 type transport system ATP-binding protein